MLPVGHAGGGTGGWEIFCLGILSGMLPASAWLQRITKDGVEDQFQNAGGSGPRLRVAGGWRGREGEGGEGGGRGGGPPFLSFHLSNSNSSFSPCK